MSDSVTCENMSVNIKPKDECRDHQRGACQRGQKCKYIHVDCALKPDDRELFIDNLLTETLEGFAPKFFELNMFEGINKSGVIGKAGGDRYVHKSGKRVFSDNGKVLFAEERSKRPKLDEMNTNGASNCCSNDCSTPSNLTPSRCKPICKDFLKGRCMRSICCKYRHMSLDEFEEETFEKAAIHVINRLLAMIEDRNH